MKSKKYHLPDDAYFCPRWLFRFGWFILALLVAFWLSSCVAYRGADGTTFSMVGTNAEQVRAGGLSMNSVNQADGIKATGQALKDVARMHFNTKVATQALQTTQTLGADVLR